ncbi:type II secretion system GspH family protein [Patescibacteria group bacterium]|nr:type II secretion system GspH family protein [Patescibacteria group bacterium]MBU1890305.1 type II secretion system GspH family protein [Patescibacteria group bacterium]
MNVKDNKKGFTLIELLVVIAIIGLLSTLAIVSLATTRQKSRDSRRSSDIRQMQTAVEMYNNETGSYPSNVSWALLQVDIGPYLVGGVLPTPTDHPGDCADDPAPDGNPWENTADSNVDCYIYCSNADGYLLGARHEDNGAIDEDVDGPPTSYLAGECVTDTYPIAQVPAFTCLDEQVDYSGFCLGTL